ncbi:glycosyltransferase family 4 protein [Crateriforma conspicua]|uniref:glycosyltransferase family 4 protein n=1 Tax=Crateriforma conspicua TaxID=2527996 RepID=UPI00118A3A5F|nr:glycosyltransferase family 4 protein [Crateriforma conspicua]QDV63676.1 D-inositol-3-phosphate glycosyltransferase [Crateriforma conspicua]
MSTKSRPCLVTSQFDRQLGGAANTIDKFRNALNAAVLSYGGEEDSDYPADYRVPIPKGIMGRAFGMPRACDRHLPTENFNLVSSHLLYRYHCEAAYQIHRKQKAPLWIVPHGGLDPYVFSYRRAQKASWLKYVASRYFRSASRVIFATRAEKNKALNYVAVDKTAVINWPVSPIELSDAQIRRKAFRRSLGISDSSHAMLYLGRVSPMKRPEETIAAFAAAKRNQEADLIIVGNESGITLSDLHASIPPSVKDHVHIVGPLWGRDRDNAFLGCDSYITLSFRENFGHTVAEALSAELPIVSAPGIDLLGELPANPFGIYLKSDDFDEAVAGIEAMLDMAYRDRKQIGSDASAWVRTHLTAERFRSQLLDIYRQDISSPESATYLGQRSAAEGTSI